MRIVIPQPLTHMPELAARLSAAHEVVPAAGTTEADLIAAVADADALVATAMTVSASVLEAGGHLLAVGTPQVGFDRIDVAAASRLGIAVLSAAGAWPATVAEYTVGAMLYLGRRFGEADHDLRTAGWSSRPVYAEPTARLGIELRGRTVGIVGVGSIGLELARTLSAGFGCRLLGFDPYVDRARMASHGIERRDDLLELAAEVDFLVLHVPLTDATYHLVDKAVLASMKPTSYVINVARGGIVDETALVEALRSERLAGAALDVFEHEPLRSGDPLVSTGRLLLTPHIAGVTHESNRIRAETFADRLLAVLRGERPAGLANPDAWDAIAGRRESLLP